MLNDKRVAATVIAEAKHGTLKYRQHGDRLDLIGDGWALMIYQEYAKNKLRKKFGFSAGGLTVVVPKNSDEIVQEGKTLRHCVGGYAARHMDGKVVILFIRKARRPERSFLTVELSPDDKPRVRQVHGYRNDLYAHSSPEEKYAWFFDTWLGWVRAGSRRDRKGNPIVKEEAKTA